MNIKLTDNQYTALFNLQYLYCTRDGLGYDCIPMKKFLKEQYNCDYIRQASSLNYIISGSEEDITFLLLKL